MTGYASNEAATQNGEVRIWLRRRSSDVANQARFLWRSYRKILADMTGQKGQLPRYPVGVCESSSFWLSGKPHHWHWAVNDPLSSAQMSLKRPVQCCAGINPGNQEYLILITIDWRGPQRRLIFEDPTTGVPAPDMIPGLDRRKHA
jgi:hypothetical protein